MLLMSLALLVTIATNTNYTAYVAQPHAGEWELAALYFTPDSTGAVSIDGTNYITVTAKQGSTSLGSFTTFTGGTALVAGTAVAFTLTGGASLVFSQGDILTIDSVKTGTGAVLKGTFTASWRKKQADAYYT